MYKKLSLILILVGLIFISGCGLDKVGKTCTQECVKEETYCAQTRQKCIDKNFWGNCVEFEEECARYDRKCVQYGEVCR